MFSWVGKTATSCLRPSCLKAHTNRDGDDGLGASEDDVLLWYKDLEKHSHGEFSMAVVQANASLEDKSQVEAGRRATFIGVYDGHGGAEASTYVSNHLFPHLLRLARENEAISENILTSAISETESGFLALVGREFATRPAVAAIGSCCLVGVIWKRALYVANLGDSRAVMGYLDRWNKIVALQITKDHNASVDEVRLELRELHPDDPQILVLRQNVWRIKGIIQVSRAIGDAYLKMQEFALSSDYPRFHLPEPLRRPVLRDDPQTITRHLQPSDKFLIFASDGLWEFLTNQEAVEIVHNHPRVGIARRLFMSAMVKAAERTGMPYREIKKLDRGVRRAIHDDITIVVIFMDHETLNNATLSTSATPAAELSVRGFVDAVGPSDFNFPQRD